MHYPLYTITLSNAGKDYSGPSCCASGFSCQDYAIDYKRCLPGQGEVETTTAPPVNPNNPIDNSAANNTPSTPGDMTSMVCADAGEQCGGRSKTYTLYVLLYTYASVHCTMLWSYHLVIHRVMQVP
jgi:Fungal cellulose binding domain